MSQVTGSISNIYNKIK